MNVSLPNDSSIAEKPLPKIMRVLVRKHGRLAVPENSPVAFTFFRCVDVMDGDFFCIPIQAFTIAKPIPPGRMGKRVRKAPRCNA